MLTAHAILKQCKKMNIIIEPFDINQLNPNSYNVRLSNHIKRYDKEAILDPEDTNNFTSWHDIIIPNDGIILLPGYLYIGSTVERIASDKYISCIDGRSSIGRLGIQIHSTAGFGDIGFDGTYTLEITVIQPTKLYPNMLIGQIYFEKPDGKVDFLYNGRYQHQQGPELSAYGMSDSMIKGYHYNLSDHDIPQ